MPMTLSYHPTCDTPAIIITAVVSLICIVLIYAGLFHYAGVTKWLLLVIGLLLELGPTFLFPLSGDL